MRPNLTPGIVERPTSFVLTELEREKLKRLSKQLGLSRSKTIRLIIQAVELSDLSPVVFNSGGAE